MVQNRAGLGRALLLKVTLVLIPPWVNVTWVKVLEGEVGAILHGTMASRVLVQSHKDVAAWVQERG